MSRFSNIHLAAILFVLVMPLQAVLAQNPEFDTPEPSRIWEHVMVTDIHGWDHPSVTIQWIGGGEALLIRRDDGATRTVTPDQILHVYDADGRDITAEVANGRLLGSQPDLPGDSVGAPGPGGDEIGGTMQTPNGYPGRGATLGQLTEPYLFNYAMDIGGGYGSPTGNWFEGLNGGVNYQLGARILFSPRSYVRFAVRHQDLGEEALAFYDSDFNVVESVTVEFAVREYMFLFGHHSAPVQNKAVRSMGYGEVGISFMDHQAEAKNYNSDRVSDLKTGLVLQGGVLVFLDRQWALDFSGGVTWKLGMSDDEGMGMLMGAHVALVFLN